MFGLYEKTKLGTTRKMPELKIFSFIVQLGVDTNDWTHHIGRMEPNLLPRPFMILCAKEEGSLVCRKDSSGIGRIERSGGLKTFMLVTVLFMWMAYQHLWTQLR
jgi:hypothetical protein